MIEYIAECPIEHFKNYANTHGIDEFQHICLNSVYNGITLKKYGFIVSHQIGYTSNVEYVYSEKLSGYCVRFYCQLYKKVEPKSFMLNLSSNRDSLFLTIIE